jgi:hypothetical protein
MFRFVFKFQNQTKAFSFQKTGNPCFRTPTKKGHILQPSLFFLRRNNLRFISIPLERKDDPSSPQVEIVDPKSILLEFFLFCCFIIFHYNLKCLFFLEAGVTTVQNLRSLDKDIVQNVTGIPKEQLRRTVIIYNPTRNSMQSGVKVCGESCFLKIIQPQLKNEFFHFYTLTNFLVLLKNSRKHISGICNFKGVLITGKIR